MGQRKEKVRGCRREEGASCKNVGQRNIFTFLFIFFLIRQMESGRLRPVLGPRSQPTVHSSECPCNCCCCCHSSIFVSLCSACLKDCNIYLNFFLPLTESFACCKGLPWKMVATHKQTSTLAYASACFTIPKRNNNKTNKIVQATHFDFGICGFLCNSWLFHICMHVRLSVLQIYCLAWRGKKNFYARIWPKEASPKIT